MHSIQCMQIMKTTLFGFALAAVTVAATPLRLVSEAELPGTVVMIWPEQVRGQSGWVSAYAALIEALPPGLEVAVVGRRPPSQRALQQVGRPVRYVPAGRVTSLAIGEWGGWPAADQEGRLTAVIPLLPNDDHRHTARDVAAALYGNDHSLDLHIRSGAFIHNGHGVAVVSQRVLADNESLSIQEVEERLSEALGLIKVVWVPVLPGDADGLCAGWLSFVSDKVVLQADYDEVSDATRHAFSQRLTPRLRRDLGRGYQVLNVPAIYADAIRVGDTLVMRGQDPDQDARVERQLRRALPDMNVHFLPPGVARGLHLQRMIAVY